MKTLLTIVLFVSLGLCISCDLGLGIHEPTELEKLPPLTATGENTFGCLVNGEAFVVKSTSKQVAIFQQGQLQFGASLDDKDRDESLSLNLIDPLHENEIYLLTDDIYHGGYTIKLGDSICLYEFGDTNEGFVMFHNIDRTDFIISGTFEFSTVTEDCDTVRITDGRFDMQYIP